MSGINNCWFIAMESVIDTFAKSEVTSQLTTSCRYFRKNSWITVPIYDRLYIAGAISFLKKRSLDPRILLNFAVISSFFQGFSLVLKRNCVTLPKMYINIRIINFTVIIIFKCWSPFYSLQIVHIILYISDFFSYNFVNRDSKLLTKFNWHNVNFFPLMKYILRKSNLFS